MQKIQLSGTVELSNTPLIQNRPNYIIKSLIDNSETSVTQVLDTIFKSKNAIDKIVEVKGVIYNSSNKFSGFGKLIIGRESYETKVESYFIGKCAIEKELFELLDNNIEITICDYSDSIGEFIIDNDSNSTEDMTKYEDTKNSIS